MEQKLRFRRVAIQGYAKPLSVQFATNRGVTPSGMAFAAGADFTDADVGV